MRIRGADGNHTQVLIDGIEANSGTDGRFDFADLLVEDIERIEVIRGPQSALYGSDAIGGVVNIITKSGRGPLTITGRAEYGSFHTRDVAARVSGGTDKAWGAVTVHRQATSGFNVAPDAVLGEDDGSRVTSVSAKAGFRPFAGVEINFNYRNTAKVVERDDQTAFGPGSNRGGFIVATDSRSRQDGRVQLMGVDLRWDMLGGALTHVVKANRNTTERNDLQIADYGFGITPSPFNNTSVVDKLGYQATYRFATPTLLSARHSLTGLVQQDKETFTPGFDRSIASADGSPMPASGAANSSSRLDLSAGASRDDNDSFTDYTTWRTTASLRLPEIGLRPHASVGTAIRLPSQFEQFGVAANFVANQGLKAEESRRLGCGRRVHCDQGSSPVSTSPTSRPTCATRSVASSRASSIRRRRSPAGPGTSSARARSTSRVSRSGVASNSPVAPADGGARCRARLHLARCRRCARAGGGAPAASRRARRCELCVRPRSREPQYRRSLQRHDAR